MPDDLHSFLSFRALPLSLLHFSIRGNDKDSLGVPYVLAECAVEIGDTILLVTKDNGQIIDLTDTDRGVDSLRAYTLYGLLESQTVKRIHLLALSYNHNALEIHEAAEYESEPLENRNLETL